VRPDYRPTAVGFARGVLVVPPEMVRYVREGLHSAMGDAAAGMLRVATLANDKRDPLWYREPLDHFDRVRRVLDLVGWYEDGISSEVHLDLREHRHAVIEALRMEVSFGSANSFCSDRSPSQGSWSAEHWSSLGLHDTEAGSPVSAARADADNESVTGVLWLIRTRTF
jgi:hypothetical protein